MAAPQFEALAKAGSLSTGKRAYAIEGVSSDGDITIATLATPRARFTAIHCVNTRVAGRPGAEVFSVINSSGREVDCFAIHGGAIIPLAK